MSHIHCREREHAVEFLLHDDGARALLHDGFGQEVHLVNAAWKVPSYTAGSSTTFALFQAACQRSSLLQAR